MTEKNKKPCILIIFGTRPEAIKMLPLVRMLASDGRFIVKVAVTAQHREMLDQVLSIWNVKPDYDLNIMKQGQSLYDITINALGGLEKVLNHCKPDLVLVHGDTTTTFVGSLAAFYKQIPVGHVEAGLRSHNKYNPYPEEMNRKLTGCIANLNFAPTVTAKVSLMQEGVNEKNIFITGNTVIDALQWAVKQPAPVTEDYKKVEEVLKKLQTEDNTLARIITLTCHRRESIGKPMEDVFKAARKLLEDFDDVVLVVPMHKNPLVRKPCKEILGDHKRAVLIEPMEYLEFSHLLNKSYLILTDSGGLQEEAPSLGKPVLVMRQTTERPEAIEAGTAVLCGTDTDSIYSKAAKLLIDKSAYMTMAKAINPYGDGQACRRIVNEIANYFRLK